MEANNFVDWQDVVEDDDTGSLLTPKSLQLSVTAPRCPPYYTAQRSLLIGRRPRPGADPYLTHHTIVNSDSKHSVTSVHKTEGVQEAHDRHHERLMDRFFFFRGTGRSKSTTNFRKSSTMKSVATSPFHHNSSLMTPHPHLPSLGPDTSSQATRVLGTLLPLKWQNHCRDSGGFRWIADSLVKASIPFAALSHPGAAKRFVQLTRSCRRLQYGDCNERNESQANKMQFMDVFLPDTSDSQQQKPRGMVFFVHGGAWGSGTPWFYRLVAVPFLQCGLAVSILGYRVYPVSQSVQDQVNDVQSAFEVLVKEYPAWCCSPTKDGSQDLVNQDHLGTIVMGHSSGAHISLLWMVDRATRHWNEGKTSEQTITTFVGISGPYNIDHHFDYEAARGVEEISPLKAANGFSRTGFLRNSPVWRLQNALTEFQESEGKNCLQDFFPSRMLLIHGIEDDTVPFTASSEAARVLRSCGVVNCQEYYVPETGHQDAVVHLMLGGRVRNAIIRWLFQGNKLRKASLVPPQSRL
ncbi:hypothetical protein IV203_018484 [Nitzschia inconspicua]|uniref:BD-FAE-like domain-containing protein n=1 Tax=Nitzschia inconspicua TaxID=303405 RepID=A0A9K3Q6E5_9STRA|nr:hypothetical protein IV203_018484 [Nitzschia inconspicua]